MTLQLIKKHNFDTVFDSQRVFRLILDAMSSPTKIVNIKEYADKLFGDCPVFMAAAMTLLDNEVSFHVCGDYALSDEIASLTLAKQENLESADFIFVNINDISGVIENAKRGTLVDPHKSATVIILNDNTSECSLTLFGPGIDGQKEIQTSGAVKDLIALRDVQNYEYPQGIDLIFISSEGELFAIPRLTKEVR